MTRLLRTIRFVFLACVVVALAGCARVTVNVGGRDARQDTAISIEDTLNSPTRGDRRNAEP